MVFDMSQKGKNDGREDRKCSPKIVKNFEKDFERSLFEFRKAIQSK